MKILSHSVTETERLGKKIAAVLKPGDILCLFGEFGAGKTVLTKGIAMGFGIQERDVVSPSFVLMREYKIKLRGEKKKTYLYHFDFYRLEEVKQILDLGYEEYLYGDGVTVVEWAQRLGQTLPKDYVAVHMHVRKDDEREIVLGAHGARSKALLKRLD